MSVSALAGRFAPRAGADAAWEPRLVDALRPDGRAEAATWGPLAVGASPRPGADGSGADPRLRAPGGFTCLFTGRPRADALAAELGLPPESPPGATIAAAYSALGADLVERLRGDFALLVWDDDARTGLLARDALGAEPLFVAESGGALLFASEVRNLLRMLPARPAPDEVAMAQWLARRLDRAGRTLFRGIAPFPPAHVVELGRAGWRRRRYWAPSYVPPEPVGADDAATTVRHEVAAAVRRALDGAERPAVMLSGGLDSSSVAAATLDGDTRPTAYSAFFPDEPAVDESHRVGRVLDRLGLPAVIGEFHAGSALAAGVEFIAAWAVPSVTPNLFVWLPLLRRAAADGIDVVLDGEGGDELFGCARYLVADRLMAARPLGAARVARRLPGMGARPRPRWVRRALLAYGVRGAVPYRLHERVRRRPAPPSWMADAATAALEGADDPWAWKRRGGPRWWAQLADALTDASHALGAADQLRREGALAGVSLRHPLRDRELVEFALRLPPELAFDPALDRPLARRAWAGELPREVAADDAKPVYNALPAAALRGRDREGVSAALRRLHPELARLVRPAELELLLAGGAGPAWPLDVWRVVTLQLWLRQQEDPAELDRVRELLDPEPAIAFAVVP